MSARVRSHYLTGLDWAKWVTSVQSRREDRLHLVVTSRRPRREGVEWALLLPSAAPHLPTQAQSFFFAHFPCSTVPQAFPRPDRRMPWPTRAGRVEAGRSSAATVRLGLYTTEHDGRLSGFGASASIASGCVARGRGSLPGSPFSSRSSRARRIMDLRKLRCRYVPNGVTNVLPKESRGRRGPSRQGRSFALAANENARLKRLLPHATTGTAGW
jgi:hypothetical protein